MQTASSYLRRLGASVLVMAASACGDGGTAPSTAPLQVAGNWAGSQTFFGGSPETHCFVTYLLNDTPGGFAQPVRVERTRAGEAEHAIRACREAIDFGHKHVRARSHKESCTLSFFPFLCTGGPESPVQR